MSGSVSNVSANPQFKHYAASYLFRASALAELGFRHVEKVVVENNKMSIYGAVALAALGTLALVFPSPLSPLVALIGFGVAALVAGSLADAYGGKEALEKVKHNISLGLYFFNSLTK